MSPQVRVTFVNHLPDLMTWKDYAAAHERKIVRIRLTPEPDGLEILVDSPYPQLAENLLAALGPEAIEMMLCG
ncbi:MAG TPA: radical SAM-modified peptide, FtsH ternary system-associated [Gemmataceae bacterium]|nr:radical SAM-modified peptide, FtsH ternary system-associated [Gemmataceae bacterium]HXR37796.1 radical SAM-modified peptide, FtsH ternary system-associated [Terracidiphilus sp.]